MVIDIISYTDAQYAALTRGQLQQVRAAQNKKNKLAAELAENLEKEKYKLVENGTFLSTIWTAIEKKLQAEFEAAVEAVREDLLFYLRFTVKADEEIAGSTPYPLDYSLTGEERFAVVKAYYEGAYTDGTERFAAFAADEAAKGYLGEWYAPLYDYFLENAESVE
ncbi:MAG: hypothetical protein IJX87_06675 [Clostridia bacterium]|nr:hypothetical protein [Clostridia bacterium]